MVGLLDERCHFAEYALLGDGLAEEEQLLERGRSARCFAQQTRCATSHTVEGERKTMPMFSRWFAFRYRIGAGLNLCIIVLLVGCGATPPPPWGYLATEATSLLSLTWSGQSSLTGRLMLAQYPLPWYDDASTPKITTALYHGTRAANGQVILTVSVVPVPRTLIGQLHGNTLMLAFPTGYGQITQEHLVPVTATQQEQLLHAFEAFGRVRVALARLSWTMATSGVTLHTVQNLDENGDLLKQAALTVQQTQQAFQIIQQEHDETTQCQQVTTFWQTTGMGMDGTHLNLITPFQATPSLPQQQLLTEVAAAQAAWKVAQPMVLPRVTDLPSPLPWVVTATQFQEAMRQPEQLAQAIHHELQRDQQQLAPFNAQESGLLAQIQAIGQSCPS